MKKEATRKPNIKHGTVRKLTGGGTAMDFVEELTDFGAPEYAVTGVASIERISAGQVRISKYSRRKDGNIVVFHEVWDYQTWRKSFPPYEEAMRLLERLGIGDGPNQGRQRGAH